MKIELMEDGLDEALRDIQNYLGKALSEKNKHKKDLMISHAYGIAEAIYKMVTMRIEDDGEGTEEVQCE